MKFILAPRPSLAPNHPSNLPVSTRGYDSRADRERAIKRLSKMGYNYFLCYQDTNAEFALHVSWCSWAGDHPHVGR